MREKLKVLRGRAQGALGSQYGHGPSLCWGCDAWAWTAAYIHRRGWLEEAPVRWSFWGARVLAKMVFRLVVREEAICSRIAGG